MKQDIIDKYHEFFGCPTLELFEELFENYYGTKPKMYRYAEVKTVLGGCRKYRKIFSSIASSVKYKNEEKRLKNVFYLGSEYMASKHYLQNVEHCNPNQLDFHLFRFRRVLNNSTNDEQHKNLAIAIAVLCSDLTAPTNRRKRNNVKYSRWVKGELYQLTTRLLRHTQYEWPGVYQDRDVMSENNIPFCDATHAYFQVNTKHGCMFKPFPSMHCIVKSRHGYTDIMGVKHTVSVNYRRNPMLRNHINVVAERVARDAGEHAQFEKLPKDYWGPDSPRWHDQYMHFLHKRHHCIRIEDWYIRRELKEYQVFCKHLNPVEEFAEPRPHITVTKAMLESKLLSRYKPGDCVLTGDLDALMKPDTTLETKYARITAALSTGVVRAMAFYDPSNSELLRTFYVFNPDEYSFL